MSIVCAKCGGTHVTCKALIFANTKEFVEFNYNAFKKGNCLHCQKDVPLIDEEEMLKTMNKLFLDYHDKKGHDPMYVHCSVYNVDEDYRMEDAYIRLKQDADDERPDELEIECEALGIKELESLIVNNSYGFSIVEIHSMFSLDGSDENLPFRDLCVFLYPSEEMDRKVSDDAIVAAYEHPSNKRRKRPIEKLTPAEFARRINDEEVSEIKYWVRFIRA